MIVGAKKLIVRNGWYDARGKIEFSAGPLREQSGPGTNINIGPSFIKGLAYCSCWILSNYKWMSVGITTQKLFFFLRFFCLASLWYEQDIAVWLLYYLND